MASIEERVTAGAAWLDEHRPGWWQRIDLETLDLGDPCKCVLGQEYGDFGVAPAEVAGASEPAVAFGFDVHSSWFGRVRTEADVEAECAALTAEWRWLIEQRCVDEPDEPPTTITLPVGDLL